MAQNSNRIFGIYSLQEITCLMLNNGDPSLPDFLFIYVDDMLFFVDLSRSRQEEAGRTQTHPGSRGDRRRHWNLLGTASLHHTTGSGRLSLLPGFKVGVALTEAEANQYRAIVGGIGYIANSTRPDMAL